MQHFRSAKSERRLQFNRYLPLIETPCGCTPRLLDCDCPEESCVCELDIDIVDEDGRRCHCPWTAEESEAYRVSLGEFFQMLDPGNYSERPKAKTLSPAFSLEARIAVMQRRLEAGVALCHPSERTLIDSLRDGEIAVRSGNSVKKKGEVGHITESKHEARYCKSAI